MIEVIGFEVGRGTSGTLWHDAMTLTRTASWNVNHCRVLYAADEPFTVTQDDLVVTGVTGTPGVRAFSAFDFDPVAKIATWTFANQITQDVLSFALRGPDPNGWVVSVLQGDADGNRVVTGVGADFDAITSLFNSQDPEAVYADIDGDGDIDLMDRLFARLATNNNLDAHPHPAIAAIVSA